MPSTDPSTGYREFDQYLASPDSTESQSLFQTAVEAMKQATRRYAKRQVSWIRNKLLPVVNAVNGIRGAQGDTPLFLLDATGESGCTPRDYSEQQEEVDSNWDTNVFQVADNITKGSNESDKAKSSLTR